MIMKHQELHTYTLEKRFGPVKNKIIKQDESFRMIHLVDSEDISRTMGIVQFSVIKGEPLKEAHNKIRAGSKLGRTLLEHNIEFSKKYLGTIYVELPKWLQQDFNSNAASSKAFLSQIMVQSKEEKKPFLYANLIEVIPNSIIDDFKAKNKLLSDLDSNWLSLVNHAGLKMFSYEE